MIHHVFTHKKNHKKLMLFEDRDFEMQNPIEHYGNQIIVKQMVLNGISKEELSGKKEFTAMGSKLFNDALDYWLKLKGEFQKIEIPENLIRLLKTDRKKDQEKLLDGLVLTPKILTAFIFYAYYEFGFILSQYTSWSSQKNFETNKTSGAKIIDCGNNWHCFFTAYNSLGVEKTSLNKKEMRLYYISSAFGIDKAEIIKQIKSNEFKFKLNNLPYILLESFSNPLRSFLSNYNEKTPKDQSNNLF